MELLPAIDILEGKVVRLRKGDYQAATIYNEDPVAQAQAFEQAGAEFIHIVDLDGARTGEPHATSIIEQIMHKTLLHVEVGGGIRSMEAIERLIDMGVDRVILGTQLVVDDDFARDAIDKYSSALVAGIDARAGLVAVEGWNEDVGMPADDLISHVHELGFQHLIYTDIMRDGMQTGVDVHRYVELAKLFGNPVIASGGVSGIDDITALGAQAGSIEGVIAGRAVYEHTLDIAQAMDVCHNATIKAMAAVVAQHPCG
ncbi:MAG: 1-(5-phosphoribosyl)-5-[(5-phosphoribosylamino)methylideneamino]imidazole-4-carboxamide isomerase [Eggerthellaceae bacterium]|jgi:phosphoribosylformimino-5-aminoimidazole carboxamide ribotide isomerase|nr:1-(5-phosphoribosyl)-5-[(5-phosphoribosylamino)methylideneamino]imidazole-4-carboxamide isomerase [Eggerthellaceae bacterium]MCH4221097.1 1-(5-phosphoribosyl)-5-[(5-phosphoribosylamino)methylideneamino]imidazole-4-carboxamide isomerase [Eggerthellaceae bacterium]